MKVASHALHRAADELRFRGPLAFLRAAWYIAASRLGKRTFRVSLPWCTITVPGNGRKLGVGGYIFSQRGKYEEDLRCYFDDCNGAFIDVGANIGYWTCYVAGRAQLCPGRVTAIVAFEPQESIFKLLRSNLDNIGGRLAVPIRAEHVALGERSGAVKAVATNNDHGSTYMVLTDHGEIRQQTLDHFVESFRLEKIGLIKIDVEGYEYDVLAGGAETLRRFGPTVLCELVESHQKRNGRTAQEVFRFLLNLGYRGARIESDGKLMPSGEFNGDGNYLFCTV
jgi:FkbM family methyltransferase